MHFEAEIQTGIAIRLLGARIMKESEMTARLGARAPKREMKRDQFCRNQHCPMDVKARRRQQELGWKVEAADPDLWPLRRLQSEM